MRDIELYQVMWHLRSVIIKSVTENPPSLYDLGACLTQQANNQENVSLVNENNFKLSMLCTESLYNDSICDFENFLPACNFDEGDCDNGEGKLLSNCYDPN